VTRLSITDALEFFGTVELDSEKTQIAAQILKEIRQRLAFMVDVGSGISRSTA